MKKILHLSIGAAEDASLWTRLQSLKIQRQQVWIPRNHYKTPIQYWGCRVVVHEGFLTFLTRSSSSREPTGYHWGQLGLPGLRQPPGNSSEPSSQCHRSHRWHQSPAENCHLHSEWNRRCEAGMSITRHGEHGNLQNRIGLEQHLPLKSKQIFLC